MKTKISNHITKENAEKVIARLENAGRKVDRHQAEIIFKNVFEGKEFYATSVTQVCDFYATYLWNYNIIS